MNNVNAIYGIRCALPLYVIYNIATTCRSGAGVKTSVSRLFACLCLLACLLPSSSAAAGKSLQIAVATGFLQTFTELAQAFEEASEIALRATFASTGTLYNQIRNGAPYDLFLAADEERPKLLYEEGVSEQPFLYARGEVILWSADRDFCRAHSWREALQQGKTGRFTMVNPAIGPYGAAAMAALEKTDLQSLLERNIVLARTVTQAFHYASIEAVDAGFLAQSALAADRGQQGCHYRIAEAPPVIHAAVILKRTLDRDAAEQFAAFLLSGEAGLIKEKYGYR